MIQGVKGDKGDTGDTGTAGADGNAGADGVAGPAGATGATGPQRPQGDAGEAGAAGAAGSAGATGKGDGRGICADIFTVQLVRSIEKTAQRSCGATGDLQRVDRPEDAALLAGDARRSALSRCGLV